MEIEHNNRVRIFNKYLSGITQFINRQTYVIFHDKYYIKEFKIEEIDQVLARNLFLGIVGRSKKSLVHKSELNWLQNQLRMFVWTLLYYAHSKNTEIQDFKEEEWDFFSRLFPNKQRILFEYQAYNLLKSHNQYKKWGNEEDKLFERLVKQDEYRLRWSDLGKSLFIESDRKYFRTPKQCRQRWLNHLDPSKMKKCWLEEQDFTLIQYVKYFGKKWANISKKLQNRRNQHSIKNRFKSLMTKESKLFQNPGQQKELVDSLYYRMLQNKSKIHEQKQEDLKINVIEQKKPIQHQNFIFQQDDRQQESIFDYCEHTQNFLKQKSVQSQILANISLNRNDKCSELSLTRNEHLDKHVFEFNKIQTCDLQYNQNIKKPSWQQNELQKRIRADLFLQEDPFEMLKGYFYKHGSSSQ